MDVAWWITKVASYLVPKPDRDEKLEQWLADISAVNGDMWKVITALGVCSFAMSLRLRRYQQRLANIERPRLRRVAAGFSKKHVYAYSVPIKGTMGVGVSQSCAYLTVWFLPNSNLIERTLVSRLIAYREGYSMKYVTVRIGREP
jgi:hypothetical protein